MFHSDNVGFHQESYSRYFKVNSGYVCYCQNGSITITLTTPNRFTEEDNKFKDIS